jgi:hypothetical protein
MDTLTCATPDKKNLILFCQKTESASIHFSPTCAAVLIVGGAGAGGAGLAVGAPYLLGALGFSGIPPLEVFPFARHASAHFLAAGSTEKLHREGPSFFDHFRIAREPKQQSVRAQSAVRTRETEVRIQSLTPPRAPQPVGCWRILYIIFYSFDRIFLEKSFSTVFTRIFSRNYFLEKIPVNFYSGFLSVPLDCFCARSYLRSLKSLIFGGGRCRIIRTATIMHLPKRVFSRKLALQDFSREKKRYRIFLEKRSATGIFSRK